MKTSRTRFDRFNHQFEYIFYSDQCKTELFVDDVLLRTYYGERAKRIYESVTE